MTDFFLLFDLVLLFPFYCVWFKSVGFRLWWIFLCVLIWSFLFHFIAFGLSPSGLGYDGYFLFFDLGLFFPFYCVLFKSVGFRLWWIFFVFELELLFSFYCLWLKSVGLRLWFFFLFFDLGLLFPFFCLWFKCVGCRLWWISFVFWFGASSFILLPLV